MDRVHRALMAKKTDGPPCYINAKFHYYRTKEQLLAAARDKNTLKFQGHNYQLFADLSQLTISKWCAMKPHLMELQRHSITYQWGFPFSICFAHQGSKYTCRSSEELQTLQNLHLVEASSNTTTSRRRSASSSSPRNSFQSSGKNENQHSHKRGRFASPLLEQEDFMD